MTPEEIKRMRAHNLEMAARLAAVAILLPPETNAHWWAIVDRTAFALLARDRDTV